MALMAILACFSNIFVEKTIRWNEERKKTATKISIFPSVGAKLNFLPNFCGVDVGDKNASPFKPFSDLQTSCIDLSWSILIILITKMRNQRYEISLLE